jgi:hypothetical protein
LKSMSYWKGHGEAVGAAVEAGQPPPWESGRKTAASAAVGLGVFLRGPSGGLAVQTPSPPSRSLPAPFPFPGVGDGERSRPARLQ